MRIQHNIPALNAHRNLTNNNSSVSKNLEKLSSGYRINRAGDDAAGLAISEKMRAQITGLQTAQKNAEDGVSLVQTAEGALTEVHSMLNRMVELATQSANGTYSESNREEMQKEIDALTDEINRISDTSNFNGTKLFGGSDVKAVTVSGTVDGTDIAGTPVAEVLSKATVAATSFNKVAGNDVAVTIKYTDDTGKEQTANVSFTDNATAETAALDLKQSIEDNDTLKEIFKVTTDGNGNLSIEAKAGYSITSIEDGANIDVDGTAYAAAHTTYAMNGTFTDGDEVTIGEETYTFAADADGSDGKTFGDLDALKAAVEANGKYTMDIANPAKVKVTANPTTTINLHVGESSDDANTIKVEIEAMSAKSLGIDKVDITTVAGAKAAIDTVNDAIDDVSSIRSSLGAMQNRLEHTINNLGVQTENITAAESRIRDVDMAKEMMAYTKNNILVQASQAMLAQANQVPQGVLQLLQ